MANYSNMVNARKQVSEDLTNLALQVINEMLADFTEGNLKEKEEEYLTLLNMEIKEMAGQWNRVKATGGLRESLYFKENMDYATSLIELASESQVYFCRNEIIAMLKKRLDEERQIV